MADSQKNGKSGKNAKNGAVEGTPPPAVVTESTEDAAVAAATSAPATSGGATPLPSISLEGKDAKADGKKDKPKVGADTVFTGDLLRQVRESQRITLKEIAERTRISVANLSALENEKYEDLPNARVYVRGFVRCLAVEIGLDRDQVSRTYLPRWEAWFAAHNERTR